jgi:preprotein translocase subunit SecG
MTISEVLVQICAVVVAFALVVRALLLIQQSSEWEALYAFGAAVAFLCAARILAEGGRS